MFIRTHRHYIICNLWWWWDIFSWEDSLVGWFIIKRAKIINPALLIYCQWHQKSHFQYVLVSSAKSDCFKIWCNYNLCIFWRLKSLFYKNKGYHMCAMMGPNQSASARTGSCSNFIAFSKNYAMRTVLMQGWGCLGSYCKMSLSPCVSSETKAVKTVSLQNAFLQIMHNDDGTQFSQSVFSLIPVLESNNFKSWCGLCSTSHFAYISFIIMLICL